MTRLGFLDLQIALIDHFIGDREQCWRHVEAKVSCSLEIDEQFESRRKLHRQLARPLTLEDAIDVAGHPRIKVNGDWPVGHQTTVGDE